MSETLENTYEEVYFLANLRLDAKFAYIFQIILLRFKVFAFHV